MLSETNEHMKPHHKKELIKLYGEAAEIFEDALLIFLPKIQGYLEKKLKEGDTQLHIAISDSLGSLVNHLFNKIEALDHMLLNFNPVLKMIFVNLSSPNKNLQVGAAMCLIKVIQNAPVSALQATLSYVTGKLSDVLQSAVCKSQT